MRVSVRMTCYGCVSGIISKLSDTPVRNLQVNFEEQYIELVSDTLSDQQLRDLLIQKEILKN